MTKTNSQRDNAVKHIFRLVYISLYAFGFLANNLVGVRVIVEYLPFTEAGQHSCINNLKPFKIVENLYSQCNRYCFLEK